MHVHKSLSQKNVKTEDFKGDNQIYTSSWESLTNAGLGVFLTFFGIVSIRLDKKMFLSHCKKIYI